MKHLNDKDVASGLMFILFGLIALFLTSEFDFGSAARPGPGFFPIVLSVLLMLIGAAISGWGLLRHGDPIAHFALPPLILITAAVCVFSFCIEPFGLVPSVILAVLIASCARPHFGNVQRFVLAIGLAAFSALLFVVLLNLPISLWPV
ncbi:tripartite tricarboxylate transporter TctB family protein [Shimia sp.]|uniref:tripartite tricarboxylate transporter TctB family protein n=1 Tax=Shimia sp. TaxID=1954381 RepID=UPI00329A28AA